MTKTATKRTDLPENRIAEAEAKSARWLASGNAAQGLGCMAKAEKFFARSEKWLAEANRLRGWL